MRTALLLALCALGCTETAVTADVPASDDASVDAAPPMDAGALDEPIEEVDVPPDRVRVVPTEWPRTPPPFPAYSLGQCPTLRTGPDAASSLNRGFPTGSSRRQFRVLVPRSYDPNGTDRWALAFAWHWLGGSGELMVREAELERAVERYRVIVVVPDQERTADDRPVNSFTWPYLLASNPAPEQAFFDDMLACVTSQLRVDPARVHAMGVSAGALWLTALTSTPRAEHFASVAILSGGLGYVPGVLRLTYTPEPNKFPAMVLWGGPTDRLIVNFEDASRRLRDALLDDGHFVVECTHDRGHSLPPITAPTPEDSRFAILWRFLADHPYGLAPATSPWITAGLPSYTPTWCDIPPVLSQR
jgi:predicted esterase